MFFLCFDIFYSQFCKSLKSEANYDFVLILYNLYPCRCKNKPVDKK